MRRKQLEEGKEGSKEGIRRGKEAMRFFDKMRQL